MEQILNIDLMERIARVIAKYLGVEPERILEMFDSALQARGYNFTLALADLVIWYTYEQEHKEEEKA